MVLRASFPQMPKSVELVCKSSVKAIHFLSGVSGWGFPYGRKGSISLIVRLHYVDGKAEDHRLENGVQFADYIQLSTCPARSSRSRSASSRFAISVSSRSEKTRSTIELVKGPDRSAPVVVTVEAAGAE